MSCCGDKTCGVSAELEAPRRNNFYFGKLMDVLHFQMEQDYGADKRALINRLTLGEGVLCGLPVTAVDGTICVGPGVAVDALGREIVVASPVCIDPWAPPDPCGPAKPPRARDRAQVVTICLAYHECLTEYGPVMVPDCDTKEKCAAGTIVESFRLVVTDGEAPDRTGHLTLADCRQVLTAPAARRREVLCNALSDPCPAPEGDPCVPIARVELQADGTIGAIAVCRFRPRVYSNTVLLDLILCLAARLDECCGGTAATPTPPPMDTIPPGRENPIPTAAPMATATPAPMATYAPMTDVPMATRVPMTEAPMATRVPMTAAPMATRVPMTAAPEMSSAVTLRVQAVHLTSGRQDVAALRVDASTSITGQDVDGIRATFTGAVDAASVTTARTEGDAVAASFLVERIDANGGSSPVAGSIVPVGANEVRYVLSTGRPLPTGDYRITLFGTAAGRRGAIRDSNQTALDGEPLALPSGNGQPGGDFVVRFRIAT